MILLQAFPSVNDDKTNIILFLFAYRVQEIMDDDQRESGRIPRTVDCELTADLG